MLKNEISTFKIDTIDKPLLLEAKQKGYGDRQIAHMLGVSPSTVSRRLRSYDLSIRSMYASVSDSCLDAAVDLIISQFPNVGYRRVQSHLAVMGYRVTERRVRESLRRVHPVGVAYRRQRRIHRREYYVPYPNAVWHMDSNMSLVRWGFVVHGSIDGYSRMITYLECATNNRAETVLPMSRREKTGGRPAARHTRPGFDRGK